MGSDDDLDAEFACDIHSALGMILGHIKTEVGAPGGEAVAIEKATRRRGIVVPRAERLDASVTQLGERGALRLQRREFPGAIELKAQSRRAEHGGVSFRLFSRLREQGGAIGR